MATNEHGVRIETRHKKVIEGAIAVLALLVVALTGYLAWQTYDRYRDIRDVSRYADLADVAMRAVATAALERGLTAATIGRRRHDDAALRDKLAETRREVDRFWNDLSARTETTPDAAYFAGSLVEARAAQRLFEAAREQAAREAGNGSAAPGLAKWMEDSTRFIAACMRLGELAVQTADVRGTEIGLYAVPRKILWEMSEQAGLERGILAYYIAARLPVTAEDREHLTILQGRTQFGLDRVIRYFDMPGTDPRIAGAVSAVQENYLGRLKSFRVPVYAAAGTGNYPLNALEWIAQISDAIGTIHGVFDAITAVTRDRAAAAGRTAVLSTVASLLLLGFSLALVLASLTRLRLLVEDVFQQKERAEVTMNSIGDAVITTGTDGRVEYLNPAAEELTGWPNAEARGRPLDEVFRIVNGYNREPKENPVARCLRENRVVDLGNDTVLIRRDGAETTIEDSAAPVRDREGKIIGAVMVFYDVAASRGNTHLLSYHATHDRLTGLVNRAELERRLKGLLEQAHSRGGQHALCYLDIDQFKVVNDTGGHAAGDRLLRELTRQFQTRVRDTDTLSHIGGDEFGLLLVSCPPDKTVAVAEDLLQLVRHFRFEWQGAAFHLTASIGVVPILGDESGASEILAKADAACFAAKEKGRNRIQVYEPDNLEYARRHGEMQWVARLRQALDCDRFRLYCQPIVPLAAKGPMHFEILLRLEEDGQIVMPAEFIPAAERYNLMPQIDRWVARHAFTALRAARLPRGAVCNINLSGLSLGEEGFPEELRADYRAAELPRGSVCFEITETAAATNMEQAVRLIQALRGAGCRFALDDFGTGMCSFGYLKELHVDSLKIGGTFVRDMLASTAARATVQAINAVGHTLDMSTVAEHVSSQKLLAAVRKVGVDYAQGYALSRPMPIEECMQKHLSAAPTPVRARRHGRASRRRISASAGR